MIYLQFFKFAELDVEEEEKSHRWVECERYKPSVVVQQCPLDIAPRAKCPFIPLNIFLETPPLLMVSRRLPINIQWADYCF